MTDTHDPSTTHAAVTPDSGMLWALHRRLPAGAQHIRGERQVVLDRVLERSDRHHCRIAERGRQHGP